MERREAYGVEGKRVRREGAGKYTGMEYWTIILGFPSINKPCKLVCSPYVVICRKSCGITYTSYSGSLRANIQPVATVRGSETEGNTELQLEGKPLAAADPPSFAVSRRITLGRRLLFSCWKLGRVRVWDPSRWARSAMCRWWNGAASQMLLWAPLWESRCRDS